ncbi:hypothetical protein KP803_14375 [Vibrio sp. ZSDE26]|uniref:Uncharacterized protein n=1 Tax=Vibrio amylolyticus TaxID=2847292 RepID=A0A9X1XKD7_9VIBR|nr:hypothetical protein [Vibrio amylolyticus]MCK6264464.1 hypothetical protein [Vibrio amylolyticus]
MKSNIPFIAKSVIGITAVFTANHFWSWFSVDSVQVVILVGILMQACLSFFIWLEGYTASKWQERGSSKIHKIGRGITSYISLVGGKFVTMGIIAALFGGSVVMEGYVNGVVVFFGLIFLILGMEKAVEKAFYKTELATA